MDTLVEMMLDSPLLSRQVERFNRAFAEERSRRARFYEEMTEDGTWECVNEVNSECRNAGVSSANARYPATV